MEARLSGLKLYYTDSGNSSAPAIVFLHGFPFNHATWEEQVTLLAPSYRVIAYDHRGHGRSDVGDGQYIFESFVDDLIGLLDFLRIEKAILCGLSMGGYVALRAAERDPGRVRALVLCDTRSEADSDETKLRRATALKVIRTAGLPTFTEGFLKSVFAPASFTAHPAVVDRIRQGILANPLQGICGTLIALATRTDTTPSLSRIAVPTLLLVGEHDGITPPSAAKSMHDRISSSEMYVIPGAGHLSNLENPETFIQHLVKFLAKTR